MIEQDDAGGRRGIKRSGEGDWQEFCQAPEALPGRGKTHKKGGCKVAYGRLRPQQ